MDNLNKKIVVSASFLGALTIGIGAFGAHGLKDLVDTQSVLSFETGVRYQMYHVLALFMLGIATTIPSTLKKWVSRIFIIGIFLFSGSIYILSMKTLISFDVSFLGPVTPIGGVLFIIGWLRLAYGLLTIK